MKKQRNGFVQVGELLPGLERQINLFPAFGLVWRRVQGPDKVSVARKACNHIDSPGG